MRWSCSACTTTATPRGNWRVLRFGHSLLGTTNHPAPPEATGLEVDKFDGPAVRRYMEHYIGMYRDASGGLIGMGHPLGPTGIGQLAEITRQLRGEAEGRQHRNARWGMAHMIGLGSVSVAHVLSASA